MYLKDSLVWHFLSQHSCKHDIFCQCKYKNDDYIFDSDAIFHIKSVFLYLYELCAAKLYACLKLI